MSETTSADDRRSADRILAGSLRLFGGVDLLAFFAFLMPTDWMRSIHLSLGFGMFPEGPMPEYLARATSLLWAMHGALLFYVARDVRQYASLIRFVARITVLAGLLLFNLGSKTGLPMWWVLVEGPVFAATGLWYLWWLRVGQEAGIREDGL